MASSSTSTSLQTLLGAGALVVSALLAWGASSIPSDAGYAGVGPNFLPWLVTVALAVCGVWLLFEARSGGFRELEEPSGAAHGDWRAFAWVAAGVLANAALINGVSLPGAEGRYLKAGFVLSCTVCYVLAVRGLRLSEGRAGGGARQLVQDAVTGILIAAPTYWLFTKLLAINLPGLVAGGWI